MKEKIILTAFTDPMMGLSYESEPIMERLKQEYREQIEFRYVMSLLVRDVSDFMTPEERRMEVQKKHWKRIWSIPSVLVSTRFRLI